MTDETKRKISASMKGNTNGTGYKQTRNHRRNMSTSMKRSHKRRKEVEMTKERKLLLETIRLLLDTMEKPVTDIDYHITNRETMEVGENVYANLSGKD